jgi:biopolymer transport protein ExbD
MKFKRNDKRKVRAAVEMTPLIDVVFLLLIFFMLSSTFVVQTSIPIEIPESEGAEQFEQKDLSITLAYGTGGPENGGKVLVNDVEIANWGDLTRTLAEFQLNQQDGQVLIRSDGRTSYERLVHVMGIAKTVGIEKFGFEAKPPEEE